mmetsp:Transcript_29148/g.65803  ORF Transcript_29148/g.65803 Transcript_29148/m.65803 type:complete len:200 (-) Transcript_29148:259-858(-)
MSAVAYVAVVPLTMAMALSPEVLLAVMAWSCIPVASRFQSSVMRSDFLPNWTTGVPPSPVMNWTCISDAFPVRLMCTPRGSLGPLVWGAPSASPGRVPSRSVPGAAGPAVGRPVGRAAVGSPVGRPVARSASPPGLSGSTVPAPGGSRAALTNITIMRRAIGTSIRASVGVRARQVRRTMHRPLSLTFPVGTVASSSSS